jgi:hypothetical protein
LQPNDIICRVAVFPRMLREGVFDDEQFLNFSSIDAQKTVYVTSVVSQFIIRTEHAVHKYGEDVAAAGNQRVRSQNSGELPEDKHQFYLGFYRLKYSGVIGVVMDHYDLYVKWRPENNCDAHFQIEMWQRSKAGNKGEKRRDRQAAVNSIAKSLNGPCIPNIPDNSPRKYLLTVLPTRS